MKHYVECTTEFYGLRSIETADALDSYAYHLKMSGDINQTKKQLTLAIEIFQQYHGDQHIKTMSAKAFLQSINE